MLRFTNISSEELIDSVVRELSEYRVTALVAEENFESTIISLIEKTARQTLVVGFRTTNKSKLEIIEDLLVRFDHKHFKHLKNDEVIKEFGTFIGVHLKTTYTYRAESGHDDIVMSAALANHCYNEYYNPNKQCRRKRITK